MILPLEVFIPINLKDSASSTIHVIKNYLKLKQKYKTIEKLSEASSPFLVIIIDANYTSDYSSTIIDRLSFFFKEKYSAKPIHLICLVEENKCQLKDLVSEDEKKYTNPDIAQCQLLLEYMQTQNALTICNMFEKDFFEVSLNSIENLINIDISRFCCLEGFFNLSKCFEDIFESTPGIAWKPSKEGSEINGVKHLCEAYANTRIGRPELSGHDARGLFDKNFSIKSENNILGKNISESISESARNMFITFLTRDFIENIRHNTWNKIGNREINILIIDDHPDTFIKDISQLLDCWPKGKVKVSITKEYQSFLDLNIQTAVKTFPTTLIGTSCKNEDVSLNSLFDNSNKNAHNFIFVDLLLGKENNGLKIVRNLIRLRNNESEHHYDIFLFSRSTNTNDIQTALNEGACGYLFKNRIFSIPHRISEILPLDREQENDSIDYISPFSMLTKLPLKQIRKLKTTDFKPDKKNLDFIRKIPKADLHFHIGGGMDAKITLELAANILREMFRSYANAKVFSGASSTILHVRGDLAETNTDVKFKKKLDELFIGTREDKLFEKLLLLVELLSLDIKLLIEKNTTPDVKSQIIEITNTISGIKKYQVICLILFRLAFEYKQSFVSLNEGSGCFDLLSLKSKNESRCIFFKEYIYKIIEAKELTVPVVDPTIEKLIIAPKCDFFANSGMGLSQYLKGSLFTGSVVLQTEENLKKIAHYICEKSLKDGVWYREIKITPEGNTKGGLSESRVVDIYKEAFNAFSTTNNGLPIINLIIAGKRHGEIKALDRNIRLVLLDTAKNSRHSSNSENKFAKSTMICGFDLVGEEIFYDPKNFRDSFKRLFETCIPLTIHAGEETDASKIWQAVYELNADRIGHGLSLGELDVNSRRLLKRFSDHKVCIELCPKSNYLTKGFKYDDGEFFNDENIVYPLRHFIENKLQVTINTDDPGFSGQYINNKIDDSIAKDLNFDLWLSEEYLFASELFKSSFQKNPNNSAEQEIPRYLNQWEMLKIVKMGFKHAFLDVATKKDLIRRVDERIYDIVLHNSKGNLK